MVLLEESDYCLGSIKEPKSTINTRTMNTSRILNTFLLVFFLFSCEEIPPVINPITPVEASETTQQILIEEFTGVRCVNCPAGSQAIEDLIRIYGERLVVVSIHSGNFAPPYPESKIDFRMPESEAILDFIGVPIGYPTASINRKIFEGERDLQLEGRNKWAGFVAQELEQTPKIRMEMSSRFNTSTREIQVTVTSTIEAPIESENLRITAMVIENNVRDTQLTPDGIQNDYTHQHVLREVLTNPNGNLINQDFSLGATLQHEFSIVLANEILPEEVKLIAFISNSGTNKEVLQAVQASIIK